MRFEEQLPTSAQSARFESPLAVHTNLKVSSVAQAFFREVAKDHALGWQTFIGLYFQHSGRMPPEVEANHQFSDWPNLKMQRCGQWDLLRIDRLERNPNGPIDRWKKSVEPLFDMICQYREKRNQLAFEAVIREWVND